MTTQGSEAELARWTVAGMPVRAWLAGSPDPDRVRAVLIRALDRPGRSGAFGRALADHLGADIDVLYAEEHPRGAAKLAAECRARGDDPHADRLQAALVALMFCANCGRPLVDPVSIERGIGPDCWQQIDPAWRARIEARMTAPPVPVQGTLFGDGLGGRP